MPTNLKRTIPEGVWTRVTANSVPVIAFQCLTGIVQVTATNGTGEPSTDAAYFEYKTEQGDSNFVMAEVFRGIGDPDHVWMRGRDYTPEVSISHA